MISTSLLPQLPILRADKASGLQILSFSKENCSGKQNKHLSKYCHSCFFCSTHFFFHAQRFNILQTPRDAPTTCSQWLTWQIPLWGTREGLRPLLCKWMLLFPFISITSHQNSSPTEVATVPLAIKIMLGHAMVVCDSTVGNKSTSSSGNDANSWVVNLEQCRQKPSLWFLQETRSGPRLHVSVWALLQNIKREDRMEQHQLISVFFTAFYMQWQYWKGGWVVDSFSLFFREFSISKQAWNLVGEK